MQKLTRRGFIAGMPMAFGAIGAAAEKLQATSNTGSSSSPDGPRIGLVTYNLARNWDVPTIIANCTEAGFEAVELRTTHAHGVEVDLSSKERAEVHSRFEDSPVRLASLGSAFEYHSPDPAELKKNIEGTREFCRLAADLGCDGIKVRPNRLLEDKGIPREKTIALIAESLTEVGRAAADMGVEIRVEVHGRGTSRIPVIHDIFSQCESPNVYVCWNCNQNDLLDGGLEKNFSLLADKIHFVHMRDLFLEEYPWRKMLALLNGIGYKGFCCAEIPESSDPVRVMKYYRALFLAYQDRL
ncbi:MAG: sugar phosphate isomerase/epimerase family protein [Gemmatimonadota bacterium]|nr:sugar phosphate isomerase/epimerase family protein [Gemmatimonadota bacterium]